MASTFIEGFHYFSQQWSNRTSFCVLADLDSTVADTRQRQHLAPKGQAEQTDNLAWVDYAMACGDDVPNEGVCVALRELGRRYPVFYISGRSAKALNPTLRWLDKAAVPIDGVRLRDPDDPHSNTEHKLKVLKAVREAGWRPILFFEDWPAVAQAFIAEGVPTICVNPMYDDKVMSTFAAATEEDPSAVLA